MLTRLDHAVIAVRDLDRSTAAFRRLGFDAQPGGAHPAMGTANLAVRLDDERFTMTSAPTIETCSC